jgi:hypothetical protein
MRMKILYRLLLLLLLFTVPGCKKGEDDPSFTLVTRKSRMTGEWKLQSGELKIVELYPDSATAEARYKFDAGSFVCDVGGIGAHFEGSSFLNLSVAKDGTFRLNQTTGSDMIDFTGTWDFENGNGERKNKESIVMTIKEGDGTSYLFSFFNKSVTQFSYHIRELRKNKMVLTTTEELVNNFYNGPSVIITSQYTFVQ